MSSLSSCGVWARDESGVAVNELSEGVMLLLSLDGFTGAYWWESRREEVGSLGEVEGVVLKDLGVELASWGYSTLGELSLESSREGSG